MTRNRVGIRTLVPLLATLAAACAPTGGAPSNNMMDPTTHDTFFPIAAGSRHALGSDSPAITCNSCHGGGNSFTQFDCLSCHAHNNQATLALGHSGIAEFNYDSASCYSCHPRGTGGGVLPPGITNDPARDVSVDALIPSYVDTSISGLSPQTEMLPMLMDHASKHVDAAAFASCGNCHVNAGAGAYYPGDLHTSLDNLGLAQPSACGDCHATSEPMGFVGPTASNPARTPASGEMKHDAVLWSNGGPTVVSAVPQECGVCHVAPTMSTPASWAANQGGTTPALFHASLTAAHLPQPTSCVDCHANSRPNGVLTVQLSTVPATSLQYDHTALAALADCGSCHQSSSSAAQWTSWAGGKFHLAGAVTPATCLPCHAGERPTTTSNWTSTTYTSTPFDYVTNAQGVTHGDGQDCAVCHNGPGTGAWGGTQNWVGGNFTHGATTISGSTCIACHSTQRPDLNGILPSQIPYSGLPFDHSQDGTGDCFGCHQATVRSNYANYRPIPGGDWKGAVGYPGSTLISAPGQFVTVTETTLQRSGVNNLVTSMSSIRATLNNSMLHTSSQVPASLVPANSTDWAKCSQCHAGITATGAGQGSSPGLQNGQFHPVLTALSLPQPSNQCGDCHVQMRPAGIVQKAGSDLLPMDHNAMFTSAVTIVGASVTGVAQIECAVCHKQSGVTWADGIFHAKIGAAVPADCTTCHYPLMADTAKSDLASGVNYTMKHASSQITVQNCKVCHATALSKSTTTPAVSTLWQGGLFHPSLTSQPSVCIACHAVSVPAANASTQSSWTYTLPPLAGTSTNAAQWMNHGSTSVAGKDCVVCHAADAKTSGSAWSKSDYFHAAVTNPSSCKECHGLTNGGGSVAGTKNNLPVGLTNSNTVTSAAADSTTGIAAGTFDQITHTDINVSNKDCNFCHTQKGVSTVAGVQGKEWAQAAFHASFTSANPLVINGTTGRCSNCHMNVKPGLSFTLFDHSAFTANSGTQDCNSCHMWPGTGTPTAANWLGASSAPPTVTLTNWGYGSPTTHTVTFAHPRASSYTSCAQCHVGANYSTVIDYNHDGLTSNVIIDGVAATINLGTSQYNMSTNPTFCVACHNTGSPWVTRTGLTSTITANTTSGSTTVTTASTSALTVGMTIAGTGIPNTTTTTSTFVANTTSGSTTVTTASPISLSRGTVISGPGIPANDTVALSVSNATSFTLTAAATATATGVTLTATRTTSLTVTIKTIPSATSITISTAANATTTGTTLSVTHRSATQQTIGSHGGSTIGQDCTSCHYVRGSQSLTPPTPGVFSTGGF